MGFLTYLGILFLGIGFLMLIRTFLKEKEIPKIPERDLQEVYSPSEDAEMLQDTSHQKKIEGGGVILIGPIPIVFGNSKYAVIALLLTIILMILALTFMVRV